MSLLRVHNNQLFSPCSKQQNLLDLRTVFDRFLVEAFDNSREFLQCIGSGFEEIVNMHKRAPEYLSIYVDDKLKRGIKEVRPTHVGLLCFAGCVPLVECAIPD